MAQKRLRDYLDNLDSFEHNLFNLGLHGPGRFCGFDTLTSTGNVADAREFKIDHTKTGFSYKNAINNVTGPCGVLLSPQGTLVQEDASVGPLTVDTNAGNAFTRYDLIYMSHDYIVADGGQAAVYGVVKGPLGSDIKPILADPLKQVAIGIIEIPPGATNVGEFIWHKSKNPDSGDGEDARLSYPNVFKAYQGENKSAKLYVDPSETVVIGANTSFFWDLDNDGNVFRIEPQSIAAGYIDGIKIHDVPIQEGMRIRLMLAELSTLRENTLWLAEPISAKGYKSLRIPQAIGNTNIGNAFGGNVLGVRPSVGEEWECELVFYKDRWTLVKIGGAGQKATNNRGDLKDVWGVDLAANFDATGLGINLQAGWALCNGLNGTPDLRGKGRVMATNVQAPGQLTLATEDDTLNAGGDPDNYIYGNAYSIQGSKKFSIQQVNLPAMNFPVTDPGHFHAMFAAVNSGVKFPGINDYVPYSSNQDNGNQDYDMCRTATTATVGKTGSKSTGISVSSGGLGTLVEHIDPVGMCVTLMKL